MNIFIKTCPRDFLRVEKLLNTLDVYNKDNIPITLCIEKKYEKLLYDNINVSNIEIIFSEDILKKYNIREMRNKLNRWQIQQVIKFEYVYQSSEDNFMIIDSDSILIKPFFKKDLYNSDGNLYTVMSNLEDRIIEMSSDVIVSEIDYNEAKKFMQRDRKNVQKVFNREGEILEFGPPPVLWSKKVVTDFYENYLLKNKKTFVDIINEIPIEYNWYGEWLLESKCIPLSPIEPLFKNISSKEQYDSLIEKGITKKDLQKTYIGINLHTNWSIENEVKDYEI